MRSRWTRLPGAAKTRRSRASISRGMAGACMTSCTVGRNVVAGSSLLEAFLHLEYSFSRAAGSHQVAVDSVA